MNVVDRLLLGSYNDVNTMMQCACSLVLFDGTPRWRTANVVMSHARVPSIERGVIKTSCRLLLGSRSSRKKTKIRNVFLFF